MTQNLINQQIAKNKEIRNEGRMEGAVWALIGGLFYLILIAAIL